MEEFKRKWPEIKKGHRIEIHINSISIIVFNIIYIINT